MSDSVYKVIELVGSSSKSWEDGEIESYRTKVKISFKFNG